MCHRPILFALALVFVAGTAFGQAVTFVVTNTDDSGPGSLRAAIESAVTFPNTAPLIRFNISSPGPWHTIRLQSPLPALPWGVNLDGESQTAFGGDTNAAGPEIELDGSALAAGDGLRFCAGSVKGLVINGFPGNGMTAGGSHCAFYPKAGTISGNYVGTDPTGTRAIPNRRGIWVQEPQWAGLEYIWTIERNVVSGNRHSGIYVAAGPQRIRFNTIGFNATRDADLGNGASGVAIFEAGRGTDVDDNFIGFNRQFGVGIAPNTQSIGLRGNSFQANWQLAIDRNFDGPSPKAEPGLPGVPAIPEITSVRYEDGATIIEGRAAFCLATPTVTLYANDAPDPSGYGEGQYFLANLRAFTFTFRHPGDLRGKWITATNMCSYYYGFPLRMAPNGEKDAFASTTSEFSRAVEVR